MKKTDFNKLTASVAFTLTAALCVPALAGADTTVGSVRNSLSESELTRLDHEENKAMAWFEKNTHVKTAASVGNVRDNLTDAELDWLNHDEGSSNSATSSASIGSVRDKLSHAELANLEHDENKSRS